MPPSLILALLIGSIFGLLFHSLFGRRLWQLPCYWISAVLGFVGGEVFASLVGIDWLRLGNIPLVAAAAGAMIGLFICWFFTSPQSAPARRRRRYVRRAVQRWSEESPGG